MKEFPIIDKFIVACEELDASILEPHLDENAVLNGLDKYNFLEFLHRIINEAKRNEILKLVKVKKYCTKCHPGTEIVEFYSKEIEVEYYRYLPYRKKMKPVFAFAILNNSPNRFDIEPCTESWGYTKGRRYTDLQDVRKAIATTGLKGIP